VLAPQDRQALLRFVTWNLDRGFRMAVVEAESHAEREQILAPLLPLVGPRVLLVELAQLEGHNLWHELLTLYKESTPRLIVLSGVVSGTEHDYMRQLNVQRDLFTRDMKVPWIVLLHPAQRVPLLTIAPDFSDYVVLWIRKEQSTPAEGRKAPLEPPPELPSALLPLPSAPLPDNVDPFLQQASAAMDAARFDEAQDLLYRMDLRADLPWDEKILRRILGARLAHRRGQLHIAEHSLRVLRADLVGQAEWLEQSALLNLAEHDLAVLMSSQGRYTDAEALLRQTLARASQTDELAHLSHGADFLALAHVLSQLGRYAEAERFARQSVQIFKVTAGAQPERYVASVRTLAEILLMQGRYADAELLLRSVLTGTACSLGNSHPVYGACRYLLGSVLIAQGKYQEAEVVLRDCVRATEQAFGSEHPHFGAALHSLGNAL